MVVLGHIFAGFLDTLARQRFEPSDLAVVGLLVVLEGVLSIDNALVLGLLARRLPDPLRRKALTYGLVGAFVFRAAAIFAASWVLHWRFVKLFGGGYLAYLALSSLWRQSPAKSTALTQRAVAVARAVAGKADGEAAGRGVEADGAIDLDSPGPALADRHHRRRFWRTVLAIELTDLAFAVDSILAAIALVSAGEADEGPGGVNAKLWVVVAGGFIGVVLVRWAAVLFIALLRRFPRFETAAYLLVLVIGLKLLLEFLVNSPAHPRRLDFHDYSGPVAWVFWGLMAAGFCVGFLPERALPGARPGPRPGVHR